MKKLKRCDKCKEDSAVLKRSGFSTWVICMNKGCGFQRLYNKKGEYNV